MHCLIVAATTFEVSPLIKSMPLVEQFNDRLSRYQLTDTTIDLLIAGIGMVPTAFHLGRQLALQHYDLAINAGIAGAFKNNLPLGTVVNVTKDGFSEPGAWDKQSFISIFGLGLIDPDTFPYQKGYLVNNPDNLSAKNMGFGKAGIALIETLPRAQAITVNTINGKLKAVENNGERTGPDIETMEGAAFLYCCQIGHIPCVQLRSISNVVEERDKSKWETDLAITNLNRFLIQFVKTLASPVNA